mmetsp:Transcript_14977/g.23191  ORF Transcript_14977/g.23191 Transcript_14977/m.23191 type:complete len:92 (+) Transcript_14977:688-963(+)
MRDAERKRLIREELKRQVKAKNDREKDEENENRAYDNLAKEHGKLLEQREKEKQMNVKSKILNDKRCRDQQLLDERRRKRNEEKEQLNQEV